MNYKISYLLDEYAGQKIALSLALGEGAKLTATAGLLSEIGRAHV